MAFEWTKGSPAYPGIPDFDPYAEWVLGPGRPYYFGAEGPRPWIPLLLLLDGVTPAEFADGADFVAESDKPTWRLMVRVPELALARNLEGYCPVLVKEVFFQELATNTKLRKRVTDFQLAEPLPADSFPPPAAGAP